jgi:amicyanin
MKKVILSAVAAALLVLAFGLSTASHARPAASEQNNSSDKYQIKIDNFSFGPSTLTVPVGATVTWINHDDVPHTVVSTDGKDIKSPVLDTDQKFTHTFAQASTFDYYCSIHPKMTGKVVVQ